MVCYNQHPATAVLRPYPRTEVHSATFRPRTTVTNGLLGLDVPLSALHTPDCGSSSGFEFPAVGLSNPYSMLVSRLGNKSSSFSQLLPSAQ